MLTQHKLPQVGAVGIAPAKTRSGAPPRIQSISRADQILTVVAEAGPDGIRLGELTKNVGLNKTTIFNLVETLLALGYVKCDETKAYSLGLRLAQLGLSAYRQVDLVSIASDSLDRLCIETRETVNLAIPTSRCAVIIDSREGSHGVRMTSYAGTLASFHASACGKAIFAFTPKHLRQAAYQHFVRDVFTQKTKTDVGDIEAELEVVRQDGMAFDLEEMEVGAHCVAVPIFHADGKISGAISVAGLRDRMATDELRKIGELIHIEVSAIQDVLWGGFVQSRGQKARKNKGAPT